MKKLILSVITGLFVLCSNVQAVEYSDIPVDFWAYNQINKASDAQIISGYQDGSFRPQQLVTRAEYAATVVNAIGQQDAKVDTMYSFEDINNNHWAWRYVIRAINLDILKPASENYFYPDDYVTRQEMITFLVNILKSEDITKKEAIIALQSAYLDFDDIPDWFKTTAGKAEVLGVIAKEPPRQQYLDYERYINRAQFAVFLYNLKEKLDSYKKEEVKEATAPKVGEGIVIANTLRNEDIVTLPKGTVLPITISGHLSSDSATPGQMFQAKFANNIVDEEHNILLSKDIILIGKVLDATKSKTFVKNGEIIFELSAVNNKDNLTRMLGMAQYSASITEANKLKKAGKTILKGKAFVAKDGQILYIKLIKQMRVNVVTGDVLD